MKINVEYKRTRKEAANRQETLSIAGFRAFIKPAGRLWKVVWS